MSCFSCTETFNQSTHRKVECPKCHFSACKKCNQRYLLELANQPHCMNCKHRWDIQFLINNLTKTFVHNKYRTRRKDLLFNIEQSKIPSSMQYVENFKKIEQTQQTIKTLTEKKKALLTQLTHIRNEIDLHRTNIWRLKENKPTKTLSFIQPCSVETCKGFLSTAWKCLVCQTYTCNHCLQTKTDTNHICSPSDIATANLIKKDTKPCPSCGEGIFKINGCDQMWCTQCHVAFSWRTNQIINGHIHNPHFYQWQRDNAGAVQREPGDVLCGGLPTFHQMYTKINTCLNGKKYKGFIVVSKLSTLHRAISHFKYVVLRHIRRLIDKNSNTRDKLILFILNRITEKQLKQHLVKMDSAKCKYSEIMDVYEIVDTVCTEQMIQLHNSPSYENAVTCLDTFDKIRNYANNELEKISRYYKQQVGYIKPSFYIKNVDAAFFKK